MLNTFSLTMLSCICVDNTPTTRVKLLVQKAVAKVTGLYRDESNNRIPWFSVGIVLQSHQHALR